MFGGAAARARERGSGGAGEKDKRGSRARRPRKRQPPPESTATGGQESKTRRGRATARALVTRKMEVGVKIRKNNMHRRMGRDAGSQIRPAERVPEEIDGLLCPTPSCPVVRPRLFLRALRGLRSAQLTLLNCIAVSVWLRILRIRVKDFI